MTWVFRGTERPPPLPRVITGKKFSNFLIGGDNTTNGSGYTKY